MKIWVDNRYYLVNNNYTIFQFCAKIGINLPCFCYHERLSIAGNCRICLVEANSALVVSCASMLIDNMKIFTKNKRIKKARESVLEFLLINHPLDCPICDQGGECDLQDILITYGSDRGRFYEYNKRSVNNLNCCGPFIKTVMTRCIHCTRCVRFSYEISSILDFGVIGRGLNMEIGTYITNFINDELLGNVIDLCPVGALISMPSSFTGRNWELKFIQSVDVLDSIAISIRIGISNNMVYRILPSLDEFYDEWITNKCRFIYDSFNIQRLSYPKLKLKFKFIIISWKLAINIYLLLLLKKYNKYIEVFCNIFINIELSYILKYFFNRIGCLNINYIENLRNNPDLRYTYLLNNTIKNLSNITELFLIGSNPRLELPLLNSYIRKSYLNNLNFKIYSLGIGLNYLTYPILNIGSSIKNFYKFLYSLSLVNKYFIFDNFYNVYFFNKMNIISSSFMLGSSFFIRNDYNYLLNSLIWFFKEFKLDIKKLNVIFRHLGRISFLESNLFYKINHKSKFYKIKFNSFNYFIGLDNLTFIDKIKYNVNIYQGFFYISKIFEYINLVLPSTIYIEESSSYLNIEGRIRYSNLSIKPFKNIISDYLIIDSFNILIKYLIINNFTVFNNYFNIVSKFTIIFNLFNNYLSNINYYKKRIENKNLFDYNFFSFNFYNFFFFNSIFYTVINNYYASDIYSKNSKILTIMSKKIIYNNFV